MAYRVVHYINQFFAGIGGEEKADYKPEIREGVVGPGMALEKVLGEEAEVVATVICGDTYFASDVEKASSEVLDLIRKYNPDGVILGPAFNAGRYGTACGAMGDAVAKELGIPVVSGMYPENPGVEMFKKSLYIIETPDSARGMGKAVPAMAKMMLKLLKGEELGSPSEEGYIERGIRKNFFMEKMAADRAIDMFVKKLNGQPFKTEYVMPVFDRVEPNPPIKDMKSCKVALVTSGGIVPKGNPDHIAASSAQNYGEYDITGVNDLTSETYESCHGGYDSTYACEDPDRVLPVDIMREMEKEGVFRELHNKYYSSVGNGTSVGNAVKFATEFTAQMKKDGVDAVIVTST